ncbi:MAG: hypothetical protein AVDCRST_MAG01-01-3228 [uncultured Rubrobacteraceae bacterium]|uniref:Uncharacterized protein n=1 Tax=uncultured Rubrobacteraceae bacterium TaxID=349277 RepID=A0A6J4Q6M5_9ACTN|nr:MAG: hypothetical protein AVDCRST_MAG01-01-3228 [uncultured Rubrobacteraceae bacterium]
MSAASALYKTSEPESLHFLRRYRPLVGVSSVTTGAGRG